MGSEWETVKLGSICKPRGGKRLPKGEMLTDAPNAHPYIRVSDFENGRIRTESLAYVPDNVADGITRYRVKAGDIIISIVGTIGLVATVDDALAGANLTENAARLDFNSAAHPPFVAYVLQSALGQKEILKNRVGSTQPKLPLYGIENIQIPLPPLPEQRAIAEVLGSLDDKIELNRRMNRTLESMARALFKSWFVDFDPVHANATGQPSLPPDLAALFPAAFESSVLGEVPVGWEVATFSDHMKAVRGLSYKGSGLCEEGEGMPMHNLNSIYEGGGYKHEGIKYYSGDYKDKHVLRAGDMIITNTEQGHEHRLIGHAAIVPNRFGATGLFSHHIYRVTPKKDSPLTRHYLYYLFNTDRWHKMIAGYSNGTSINMLPLDALKMPLLVVPPAKLVKHFDALARGVAAKIEQGLEESRTLAALRDALLPKLLGGMCRLRSGLTRKGA